MITKNICRIGLYLKILERLALIQNRFSGWCISELCISRPNTEPDSHIRAIFRQIFCNLDIFFHTLIFKHHLALCSTAKYFVLCKFDPPMKNLHYRTDADIFFLLCFTKKHSFQMKKTKQVLIYFFISFLRSILYPPCICVGCTNPGQLHCDWIHGWNYCCDRR